MSNPKTGPVRGVSGQRKFVAGAAAVAGSTRKASRLSTARNAVAPVPGGGVAGGLPAESM